MDISTIDWAIISLFFILTLAIGAYASKSAGKSTKDFFLSGRNMPWWLLGVSMVATTFSADTPNLVTDIVRKNGVAGNWAWWAFLLTGMATVFIYAKLWRRSGIVTDLEFYELRYSGKEASFLRGFRAIYLGIIFNCIIMATVMLAGIKLTSIMIGWPPYKTVWIIGSITVVYSLMGGLKGVILTDFFQFILSMIGMIIACIYIVNLPEVGGLSEMLSHPNVSDKINILPDLNNAEVVIPLLIVPLAVQWWSVWYPGAEPGGGGYIAQRMLSAKEEKGAVKATLFFNLAHYALRPWPWILIALASLIVFPTLGDIQQAFPNISDKVLADDLAFPAMLAILPKGLVGLVIASLLAALMSTLSTHLNWGSSYVVNDFYSRFLNKEASEKQKVTIGRISTLLLMVIAGLMALGLESALGAFNILLQIGAGTGLLFILRWFWWRINAYSEISAMVISFLMACYFQFIVKDGMADYEKILWGVGVTTVVWILVTFLTRPTNKKVLQDFYTLIRPHDIGWKPISTELGLGSIEKTSLATEILMMFLGSVLVYGLLFSIGFLLYGSSLYCAIGFGISILSGIGLFKLWK